MKTLEEIGSLIGFTTKAKNYKKAFYDKYIRKINYDIIIEHSDLIHIFDLKYKLYWGSISKYQKLSESFMREFSDKVSWLYISKYHKLSESFIREFKYKVDWGYISIYQKLSESFIKEFSDKLNMNLVDRYQYSDDKLFEHDLKDLSLYVVADDYVYGYKAVRTDRYSLYNFQYKYEDDSIHESHSDQTSTENSFGLSIGTKEFANNYGFDCGNQYVLLYVRTKISDITRIVYGGQKLRSRRIEILNEVEK